ncbi:hypothetical protein CN918_26770 [Priestia megaterium]|nr:hypothetical protein CN918_26770 [Priestia megaterium]
MTRKLGAAAFEAAVNDEVRGPSAKKFLKDGDSILVRIPQNDSHVMSYKAHSYYNEADKKKSVNPFACDSEKNDGSVDAFDEASAYLLAEAAKRFNPDTFVKGKTPADPEFLLGKKLEATTRGLFGFFDINNGGKEVVLDLATKQGTKINTFIKKQGESINQYAFEITKTGTGSGSDFSISACITPLTDEQKQAFDASNKAIDVQTYENSLYFRTKDQQLKDLTNIGFDVTRIGYKVPTVGASSDTQEAAEENAQESANHLAQEHSNEINEQTEEINEQTEEINEEEQAMNEAVEQQERTA